MKKSVRVHKNNISQKKLNIKDFLNQFSFSKQNDIRCLQAGEMPGCQNAIFQNAADKMTFFFKKCHNGLSNPKRWFGKINFILGHNCQPNKKPLLFMPLGQNANFLYDKEA